MNLRQLLHALSATALIAAASPALADYPDRPVRLINPYAAGAGAMDLAARVMAEGLSARLGGPVVVINQPGAAGTLAATATARGPKDGYAMYFGASSALGFTKLLNKDVTYDPVRDFTPVALLGNVPVAIFVSATSEIRTIQDLIAAAKARPGQINFGSPGFGSVSHVAVELLMDRAGIQMKHVPYGGNPNYWNDLIGGQIQVVTGGITGGLPLVKDGRLRMIATATATRTLTAPDVPAIGEVIPGYNAPAWLGLVVARGTPEPIVAKLESAALDAFRDPATKATLAKAGIEVAPLGRQAFGEKMASDLIMWEGTLKNAGLIKP